MGSIFAGYPHSATGEKPSFLLFGVDLRSPTDAAYLPPTEYPPTTPKDYREELMVTLSSTRNLAYQEDTKGPSQIQRVLRSEN